MLHRRVSKYVKIIYINLTHRVLSLTIQFIK